MPQINRLGSFAKDRRYCIKPIVAPQVAFLGLFFFINADCRLPPIVLQVLAEELLLQLDLILLHGYFVLKRRGIAL